MGRCVYALNRLNILLHTHLFVLQVGNLDLDCSAVKSPLLDKLCNDSISSVVQAAFLFW